MEMNIRELKTFDMEEILNLYDSVGWTNYTERPDMLEKAFHHSLLVLGAWDGEKLTGIIRVVGDGASIVFIQDLLVLPEYQRHGIGSQLCLEVMKRFSVAPMAWAPFAEGGHDIWNNPTLKSIGEKYGKSVAQIVLRWNIERGVCVIPKTVREERLKENGCVFDFSLDDGDREAIRKLDTGKTQIIDHLNVDTVVFLNSHRIHD